MRSGDTISFGMAPQNRERLGKLRDRLQKGTDPRIHTFTLNEALAYALDVVEQGNAA